MSRAAVPTRLATLVTALVAIGLLAGGATGGVAAAEDPCWEDPLDCSGTGPTYPGGPTQESTEDPWEGDDPWDEPGTSGPTVPGTPA